MTFAPVNHDDFQTKRILEKNALKSQLGYSAGYAEQHFDELQSEMKLNK